MLLIRRRVATTWLVLRLGLVYLVAIRLARWWPSLGRRWLARLHRRGAQRLRRHIVFHGGLLIKIGQYVASRPDIFPLDYVDACAGLRDAVPPRPLADLREQLERAYEGRLDQHLLHIEPQALAAASFGQVHRATTVDGQAVAVKIQYPNLQAGVAVDISMVRLVLSLLRPSFPGWPLDMIAEEIERTSREELDYLVEGRHADGLREGLAGQGIRVPRVFWEHCRETVLVMEFAPGVSLAQCAVSRLPAATREQIAERIVDGFLHQLLHERFFHADPHAGNVLVDLRDDGSCEVWLLDFGMTARLTTRETELYGRFLFCLQRNDTDGMVEILAQLGFLLPGADRDALKSLAREVYGELADLNPVTFKGSRRQVELAAKINEFIRRMRGLTFPHHTLLLSRATALIEGLCMDLLPDRNFLDVVRPRLPRFLDTATRLRWLRDSALDVLQDWRAVPDRIAALQLAVEDVRRRELPLAPVLAALLLLVSVLLPDGAGVLPGLAAGLALIVALLRGQTVR